MRDTSDFADKLKRYRLSKLWTQKQLANRAEITPETVCKIEKRKYLPTDLTIAKIKKAFPDFDRESAA